jgi:hypothetical protein
MELRQHPPAVDLLCAVRERALKLFREDPILEVLP